METLNDRMEKSWFRDIAHGGATNRQKEEDIKWFIEQIKQGIKHGIPGATHNGEPVLIKNEWVIIDKIAGFE